MFKRKIKEEPKERMPIDLYKENLSADEIIGIFKTSDIVRTHHYVNVDDNPYNYFESVSQIDHRYIIDLINRFKKGE